MTKCLVTGAAGFLGFYVARMLADRPDHQVVCVDNFVRGEADDQYLELTGRANVERCDLDLNERTQLDQLPADIDVIFHLAALNGTQNFYERPFEVVRCCTLPTMHLIERFAPLGKLRRFIYAGTSESYAATVTRFGWEVPTAEDVPLGVTDIFNPRWSYAASKMHGEVATVNGCRHFGVPFTVVRYHNAYGPRMGDKHVVPDFFSRARRGVYELFGYEDTRAFIYGDDAARATLILAETAAAEGQVVNVGGEREIRIQDLGAMMMAACDLKEEISLHPSPEGSVKRRAPNLRKLQDLTGYVPEVSLDEGLRRTAEHYYFGHAAASKLEA